MEQRGGNSIVMRKSNSKFQFNVLLKRYHAYQRKLTRIQAGELSGVKTKNENWLTKKIEKLYDQLLRLEKQISLATMSIAFVIMSQQVQAQTLTLATGASNPLNGFDVSSYSTPAFVDIDNDGDLDVFSGRYNGRFNYYENTGTSTAASYTQRTGGSNPMNGFDVGFNTALQFADMDNDGDFDAIVGDYYGDFHFYENTGSAGAPTFVERTGGSNPLNGYDVGSYSTITLADIDNDGDIDLLAGENNGNLNYFENTGTAGSPTFTQRFGGSNPMNGVDVGTDSDPGWVDLDNDGDFDLMIGESNGNLNYYENTGSAASPTFTSRTGASNPMNGVDVGFNSSPAFGDIDGDGDSDLMVGEFVGNFNYYILSGVATVVKPGDASATLELWLKADDQAYTNTGTTLATDGQTIREWHDQSSEGTDVTQTTGSLRPTFLDNSTDNFNYNPTLGFTNDHLISAAGGVFANGTSYSDISLYYVYRDDDDNNFDWLLYEGTSGLDRFSVSMNWAGGTSMDLDIRTGNRKNLATATYTPENTINFVSFNSSTSSTYGVSSNRRQALLVNGGEASTDNAFSAFTGTNTQFYVGDQETGGDASNSPFTGDLAEVIIFTSAMSLADRNQVESYLAIKYGKTKSNASGGTHGDYYSTDGTTIWDASLNSAYHVNVIGIGRDDDQELNQKQSHSTDDTTRLYINTLQATNSANGGSFSSDISYVMIGDNQGEMYATNAVDTERPSSVYSRLEREWKIKKTAMSDAFNQDFVLNAYASTTVNTADLVLLVDTDTDFSNATVYEAGGGLSFSYSGGVVSVTGISTTQIPSNATRYITLASNSARTPLKPHNFPGDVADNIALWLNATDGVKNGGSAATDGQSVNSWEDLSGDRFNEATDANLSSPTYRNNSAENINYNPTVEFDGVDDGLDFDDDYIFSEGAGTQDGMTWFAIVQPDETANSRSIQPVIDFGQYASRGYGLFYGNTNAVFFEPTSYGGTYSSLAHSFGTTPMLSRFEIDLGNTHSLTFNGDASPTASAGITTANLTAPFINEASTHQTSSGPFTIGHQAKSALITNQNGRRLVGNIGEVIGYRQTLTVAQINRVESYLAIKYGITLDNTGGGSQGDYTATDGSLFWDASISSTYHNRIVGIGRNDDQYLLQKQSHTLDDTTRVYLSTLQATNSANTGAFASDISFLMMGDNDGEIYATTAVEDEKPTDVYSRLEREWKVTKNNTTETFSVDITLNDEATASLDVSDLVFLVDTDTDFSDAIVHESGSGVTISYGAGTVTVSGITTAMMANNSTSYMTIGSINARTPLGSRVYPGAVSDNIGLWLNASLGVLNGGSSATDGQGVNNWQDKSGDRINDATDANFGSPTFKNNGNDNINYNSVVEFDGTNDGLDFGDEYIFSEGAGTQDGMTWFAVVQPDETSNTRAVQPVFDFGQYASRGYGLFYGNSHARGYSSTAYGGRNHGGTHGLNTAATLSRLNVDFGSEQEVVLNGAATAFRSGSITLSKLDAAYVDDALSIAVTSGPFTIGRQSKSNGIGNNNGRLLQGSIAELVGYKQTLTDEQINRVESYLSIKYSITKDNTGGGTQGDYNATDGSLLWDASNGNGYHNQVIGIGRDDNQGLLQKQSHTSGDSTRVYLSTLQTTNSSNAGSFSNDLSYVMVGNDGAAFESNSASENEMPAGIVSRLEREWKVTKTDFSDDFNVDLTITDIAKYKGVTASDLRLLVDVDGNFTNATSYAAGGGLSISVAGNVVSFRGISNAHIPDNSTRYITLGSVDEDTPLPVELLDFTPVLNEEGTVDLHWTTTSEKNNDFFTVERSKNGIDWISINKVKGAGNSANVKKYKDKDGKPLKGVSYYRLKQTDFNGEYSYSKIKSIESHEEEMQPLKVYPNPTSHQLTITGSEEELNQVIIINMIGQEMTNHIRVMEHSENSIVLDLSKLAAGVYMVKSDNTTIKFVKR